MWNNGVLDWWLGVESGIYFVFSILKLLFPLEWRNKEYPFYYICENICPIFKKISSKKKKILFLYCVSNLNTLSGFSAFLVSQVLVLDFKTVGVCHFSWCYPL